MGREPNQRAVGPYREAVDYVRGIRSLYNTYNRQQESLTAGLERGAGRRRGFKRGLEQRSIAGRVIDAGRTKALVAQAAGVAGATGAAIVIASDNNSPSARNPIPATGRA